MKQRILRGTVVTSLLALIAPMSRAAEESPAQNTPVRYRISGLWDREREDDLREAVKRIPNLSLAAIDLEMGEATFDYDPAKLFPKTKEKDILERFDNLLRTASSHTFNVKAAGTMPKDQLTRLEFRVAGLDCKGCCMAAYESIARIDGVQQATCSFKEGRMTALIDAAKTNRAALEEALKKRGVTLKAP